MRYLILALILACWSPDGYSTRDAALSVATDAPLPETVADAGFPTDHPSTPDDRHADVVGATDAGVLDVVFAETAAPVADASVDVPPDHPADAGGDSPEVIVDAGTDATPNTPETTVDVENVTALDTAVDAGTVDLGANTAMDASVDTGVDAGAEVVADVPRVPDVSEASLAFCRAIVSSSREQTCETCRNSGTVATGRCSYCGATGRCEPEVILPNGTVEPMGGCAWGVRVRNGDGTCSGL